MARDDSVVIYNADAEYLSKHVELADIRTLDGNPINPETLFLHRQDENLLLLDPAARNSIYCMDLNRGTVVEEWSPDGRTDILSIAPTTRSAQTTPEQTFIAIGSKAIFTLDPRVKGDKAVNLKTYAKDPRMNCVTSNADGNIAIGCRTGEIKLLSEVGQRAKTALPGLGSPITHIDLSPDERYLLATTDTYLLLIDI